MAYVNSYKLTAYAGLALLFGMPAIAQSGQVTLMANAGANLVVPASNSQNFSIFAPKVQTKKTRLDYSVWDEALENVVLDLGPSTRVRAGKPQAQVGTRMVRGHTSAYRLEGSRVTFAYLNDTYKQGLTDYRKDLENIASQIDITQLSRNEQLAFWFNLHNVALIEHIAQAYPIDRPARIKVEVNGKKFPLDTAKILTVRGQKLSLKDIRENIVYANWTNPAVIYGFFRGNIGSPMMPRTAYTADSVEYMLNRNAEEFVNSLRGFHEASRTRNVSAIYEKARPHYFKNWENDLEAHLLKYADENVVPEVQSGKPFKIDRIEDMIADLSGGRRLASSGSAVRVGSTMSYETQRLLSELRDKQDYLRRNDMIKSNKGYVIIEDLDPDETLVTPPPTIMTETDK